MGIFDYGDGELVYVDINALEQAPQSSGVKIVSPFDNAVIHCDRLKTLFNFDYKMECYVQPTKRRFGYFYLPILYGDKFVARIDCKAHRAEERFGVLSLHLEPVRFNREVPFGVKPGNKKVCRIQQVPASG